jgi:alpha-1,2-mannosyltransferase
MPYVYPPAFAVVLMPLSLLPYGVASTVWFVFLCTCLLVAAYVLAGLVVPRPAGPPAVAVAVVAVLLAFFQPSRASLFSTNAEVPTFLLFVLTTAALVRGRWSQAALWLGLAAAIKPTLGIFVLYFLWKRAYRATAISVTVPAVLLLAPSLIFGVGLLREFADIAAYWTQSPWAAGPINQSPYGLLLRLLTTNPYSSPVLDAPLLATVLRWTVVGLTLALVAVSVDREQVIPRRQAMLELALVVTAMLLVAPLTQDMYCIHLAIPLAILAGTVLERPRARRALLLGAGVALVYGYFSLPSLRLMSQAYYLFNAAPLTGRMILLTGVYVYGLVAAIAVVITAQRWYRRGEVGAAQPGATALAG